MRNRAGLILVTAFLSAGPALATTTSSTKNTVPVAPMEAPTIFAVRFNGVTAPSTQYAGPLLPAPYATPGFDAPSPDLAPAEEHAEGRKAMMATLTEWLGRIYDGALARLSGEVPEVPVVSAVAAATPVTLAADPRAYQAAGLKADAQLSALGLNSKVGMRLGTEEVKQTLRLSRGCDQNWLPNSIAGDVSGGFGAVKGSVQGSWGTACATGQTGWRLTAGMTDLGTARPLPNLGMEYRPAAGSLIAGLTGLSSMKAQVGETSGSVGLEAPMPLIRIDRMRLSADMSWQEESGTKLTFGTKLKF